MAFDDVYDKVTESFPQVQTIVADAAYKTPHICKKVFTDGRVLSTAYERPQTMKGGHPWWTYVYDEYHDCIICPEYHLLPYRTTDRDGYRQYASDPKICAQCPTRHLCTRSKNCVKTVLRHIWKDFEELADDIRYTPEYIELYKKRKETIERVFADAKEKHAMRYTFYRGLAQVSSWVRLKFAAMNIKKLARWKARRPSRSSSPTTSFAYILAYFAARLECNQAGRFRQAMPQIRGSAAFSCPVVPVRSASGKDLLKRLGRCNILRTFICYTVAISYLPEGGRAMKRILIVEDDALLNKTLAFNLISDGWEVTSALNADRKSVV